MDINYPHSIWRLIITPPAKGSWNMAVDEALLISIGKDASPPILRLYAWQPPCLSLGYAQPIGDIDIDHLQHSGWDLVRRPTGGRAILHTDELTYSVISPENEPRLAGGVLQSYKRISQALIYAIKLLGIEAQAQQQPEPSNTVSARNNENPVCFEVPSNYEITAQGKKLIGSAQARKKEGVLQHGSLPLIGDLTRVTNALVYDNEQNRIEAGMRLLQRATTIENLINQEVNWEDAAQAIITAFQVILNVGFNRSLLTQEETSQAHQLVLSKYSHPNWTHRV